MTAGVAMPAAKGSSWAGGRGGRGGRGVGAFLAALIILVSAAFFQEGVFVVCAEDNMEHEHVHGMTSVMTTTMPGHHGTEEGNVTMSMSNHSMDHHGNMTDPGQTNHTNHDTSQEEEHGNHNNAGTGGSGDNETHEHGATSEPGDHSGHDSDSEGGHTSTHQLYFFFSTNATIIFMEWTTSSWQTMTASCVGIVVIAALYEGLKVFRELLLQKSARKHEYEVSCCTSTCTCLHLLQSLLHMVQVFLSYCLMLVFMTFNVWLCIAVVLGAGLGYLVFCWRRSLFRAVEVSEHCN